MATSLVALGAFASQVMSTITLAASSNEGKYTVPLSPITTVLDDCEVPYPCLPCTPALRLIRNKQTAERIWVIYGQPLLNDTLKTSHIKQWRRVTLDAMCLAQRHNHNVLLDSARNKRWCCN